MKLEEYFEENKELEDNNSSIIKPDGFNHQITRSVDDSPQNIIMDKALSKNSVILEGSSIARLSLAG